MGFQENYETRAVIVAFALVFAAGAATAIGAAAVFFPGLVKLANKKTLAYSLGLAAGVMLYVSMVDIYGKAIAGFEEQGHDEGRAFIYTTAVFFAGLFLMMALNWLVGWMMSYERRQFAQQIDEIIDEERGASPSKLQSEVSTATITEDDEAKDQRDLIHMGASTALAIALHNLPEGLVTFVSYLDDPVVGVVLAVGIGIHNIPEGFSVAMPIYYATGNRWKAFLWGILSGVSEPLGALIGYFVTGGSFSGNTYGILFALVAGIMTMLAVDELLPQAHRYDPKNEVTTWALVTGMAALAGSLMLFSV